MRMQNGGAWWDSERLQRLRTALLEGIRRRLAIMKVLLAEHPADLTVLAFSEIHIAGHHFWHLGDRGHPAFRRNQPPLPDFLLDVYRATDQALGELLERLPPDANLLLFSPEGGAVNWCDLNSMVFLPEFMLRWNFPGRSLLAAADPGDAAPGLVERPRSGDWVRTVWRDHFACLPPGWLPGGFRKIFQALASRPGCDLPFYALRRLGALQWQPPVWYRPWWPRMKAFALPSYGDGYIRVNLQGREPHGSVAPAAYEEVCRELSERLLQLRDPRTGRPLVQEVVRSREYLRGVPADRLPDADLVVLWQRQANDMSEESAGRLGPLPFWKSGSHQPTGFVIGRGSGYSPPARRRPGAGHRPGADRARAAGRASAADARWQAAFHMMLSIIIVNWNTRALLQACLASIFRHRPAFAFEVVIVDNASSDGSPAMVRREFPRARLLENKANLGFAAASNRGAEIATGRYLLFLNSDTLVHEGTLVGAVSYMERHPETGVMGCRTLNADGSLQGTALAFPSATRIFANVSGLSGYRSLSRLRKHLPQRAFDYVQGSFLVIAKNVFDLCGGFDERFFLYGEDVDLCLRVRQAGMGLAYDTAIAITHQGGGSSEDPAQRLAHFIHGCLLLYKKHREASAREKTGGILENGVDPALFHRICFFTAVLPETKKRDWLPFLPAGRGTGSKRPLTWLTFF